MGQAPGGGAAADLCGRVRSGGGVRVGRLRSRGWTRLERRAAFSRAMAEAGEYVLPARFDDSKLPGLLDDMVSVDLRRHTPEQFADLVAARLGALVARPPGGQRAQAGWLLTEVRDPLALEVHRPVLPEDPPCGLPELPAYVPRGHVTRC